MYIVEMNLLYRNNNNVLLCHLEFVLEKLHQVWLVRLTEKFLVFLQLVLHSLADLPRK